MAAIDDAADAFAFCGGQLLDHHVEILHEGQGSRRRRRRGRQSRGCSSGSGVLSKAREKVGRQRHVFVKQRRGVTEVVGVVVFEDRADDAAAGKRGRGGGRAVRECDRSSGSDERADRLAARPTGGQRFVRHNSLPRSYGA